LKTLKKSTKPASNANKSRTTEENGKLVKPKKEKSKESPSVKSSFSKLTLKSVLRRKIKQMKRLVSLKNLKKSNSKDSTSMLTQLWSNTRHGRSWKKVRREKSVTNKTFFCLSNAVLMKLKSLMSLYVLPTPRTR